MYVIKNSNGRYVNQPGSKDAFTSSLERARTFKTKEEAQKECCGNEHPVNVSNILYCSR